ncbi:MAG: LysM peptidoglycan-binding domain-containing protein, partial [Anaerolineae bacterium]|nr:LysM peptidoglycan-binding domain-containing protein [Anaerolineae bacterium]
MKKTVLGAFLAATLMVLTACGQVITPQPTIVTPLVSTSTPPVPTPTLRLTATAPLLPPVATATPTIIPTPIVHVVQEGETLLSIAYEYGVSLPSLQAANGIENPLLLQIGQELTIPVGEEVTETTPGLLLPTPTPLPFDVQ